MAYRYVAYNQEGQKIKGLLEVDAEEEAEALLWQANLTVVRLKKARRWPTLREMMPTFYRPKARDIINFSRQLATLLASGIPLRNALQLLAGHMENPMLRDTLTQIVADLEEGSHFSAALAKHPQIFSSLYERLVAVGEETGRLDPMLERLASYMEREAAVVSRVRRALVYPSIVMVVGLGAAFVLLTWTVPAMSNLFKEFGGKLPWTTRLLVALGDVMSSFGLYLILILAALLIITLWYVRTPSGSRRKDYLLNRVPFVSNVLQTSDTARFASSLSTLTHAGLPLTTTMDILIRTAARAPMRDALEVVRADLLAGTRLGQALTRQKAFPRLLTQMVSTGEETGALETNLDAAATFYDEASERAMAGITTLLEPALVLFIGAGIGFVAVSVISPMYSIIGQIK